MSWYGGWRPYVPVAKRRAKAAAYASRLAKKEKRCLCPVKISGRKIASSFWGQAWCDNLERYGDFANRLPRGRTYARNGSVIDLQISRGTIKSIVSGSEIYRIEIQIAVLKKALWKCLKHDCSSAIDSLLDLLQGRFDQGVMQRITQRDGGLFPQPKEIKMRCSCPDWAGLCKHLAATLYGVGARLDAAPELLFSLRGVDHLELIRDAVDAANLDRALGNNGGATLVAADLGEVFGIDIESGTNGHLAANDSAKSSRGKGSAPKTGNRRSAAASLSAVDENVSPDARPNKRSRKKAVGKTAKDGKPPAAAAAAGKRARTMRKTASGVISALSGKPKDASKSINKRPKVR